MKMVSLPYFHKVNPYSFCCSIGKYLILIKFLGTHIAQLIIGTTLQITHHIKINCNIVSVNYNTLSVQYVLI